MAQTSWPFHDGTDGTPVLEDQWSAMARLWCATGVVGAPGDANLQVFANGSGREVHVRAGRASVRGHWFLSDAQDTLAIAANSSGNPRIDRIVVQLDPSSDEAVLAVLEGTPGASPAAPSLTQTDTGVYELPLAQVAVANGVALISSGNVTDERLFASVPYTPALSSLRPANPVKGQRVYETNTGLSVVYNGSAWVNDNQALHDAAAAAPYCRAWHTGYPSQTASVSVQKYNSATYSDAALVPVDGVFTLNRSGIWLLNGYALQETTNCSWGFQSSRFTYSPLYLLTCASGSYANVTLAHNFQAGDTVSFVCQKSTVPTIFRPAMSVTYLGTGTVS